MHKILLMLIMLLAFLTRTFFWYYGYNENEEVSWWTGLVPHGDGYYHYAKWGHETSEKHDTFSLTLSLPGIYFNRVVLLITIR